MIIKLWQSSYLEINLKLYYPNCLGFNMRIWLHLPYYEPDFNHIDWILDAWGLSYPENYSDYLRKRQIPF